MMPVGDILSTVGVFSTVRGYHEYRGGYSVPWEDIMMHVGRYHEYLWGVQYRGDTILCNLSTVGDIMSTVGVFSTMGYSNNRRFIPPLY